MKVCPVCKAGAFDDAKVCYGCLHRFTDEPPKKPAASTLEFGGLAACDTKGALTDKKASENDKSESDKQFKPENDKQFKPESDRQFAQDAEQEVMADAVPLLADVQGEKKDICAQVSLDGKQDDKTSNELVIRIELPVFMSREEAARTAVERIMPRGNHVRELSAVGA